MAHLRQLFAQLQVQLHEAMDKGVKTIQVIPQGKNFFYYENMIKILTSERYKSDNNHHLNIAKCFYEMGVISFKEKKYLKSVEYLYSALHYEPKAFNFTNVYKDLAENLYCEA